MKKLFLKILVLSLLFSGSAYAKKLVKVIYQDDQSIVFKSKRGIFSDSNEKWNKRVNQIMSISKTHCNTVNKDAYWFRGLTSGQGNSKAGIDSLDTDERKITYAMFRVICANNVNEAIKNFRRKIPKYKSELSYKPNSVYKNDISNWSSDIKLKSSDFIDKKNEEKKSIVKKETQKNAKSSKNIDWKNRDLCKNSEYKELCSKILNKKLFGVNTIANFKFAKGNIVAVIKVKRGENISLLEDPDPSYVAQYSGEHIVYKNADGFFITEFAPSSPMKHLICDNSNECIDASIF